MGRRRSKHLHLPAHLRLRVMRSGKVRYYYDTGARPRKEIPLGPDYALALKQWAELAIDAKPQHVEVITFRYVAERWLQECLASKATKTQREYVAQLRTLYRFFDNPPAPLAKIDPVHLKQYMRWRKDAPIAGTREKALFSSIWNWARGEGYTDRTNPCSGIKGTKSKREIYVYDEQFQAVWDAADEPTRDALDLLYLTGHNPQDVLRAQETDLRDGTLEIARGKTGAKVRITLTGKLAALVDRILARKRAHQVRSLALLCNERGERLTYYSLRCRFEKARRAAGVNFQLRDLRAKALTDKTERTGNIRDAQKQAGHASVTTTELYLRQRRGEKAEPTK